MDMEIPNYNGFNEDGFTQVQRVSLDERIESQGLDKELQQIVTKALEAAEAKIGHLDISHALVCDCGILTKRFQTAVNETLHSYFPSMSDV